MDGPLISFAEMLADLSGEVIRPYFGQVLTVEAKADHSPVSIADREAEAVIRAAITEHHPDHGLYGEEHGVLHEGRRYVWVIDPIDGTRAFLAGSHAWGTLIALCEDGIPVLGILDQPVTGERWIGIRGGEAVYRPAAAEAYHTIRTRAVSALGEAVVSATYCAPPDDARFDALAARASRREVAGDCYAYGLLARGARDIVCDTALKPYDILALVPIIEAAGGVITGWDGLPVTLQHYAQVLACGDKSLHNMARALLQGA